MVVGHFLTVFSEPPKAPKETSLSTGLRIVQVYDLVGASVIDPAYPLDILARANPGAPAAVATIRERAKLDYSGRRVDFLDRDTAIQGPAEFDPRRGLFRPVDRPRHQASRDLSEGPLGGLPLGVHPAGRRLVPADLYRRASTPPPRR